MRKESNEQLAVTVYTENGRTKLEGKSCADVLRTLAVAGLSYERRGKGRCWDVYENGRLVACVLGSEGFAYAFTTLGSHIRSGLFGYEQRERSGFENKF